MSPDSSPPVNDVYSLVPLGGANQRHSSDALVRSFLPLRATSTPLQKVVSYHSESPPWMSILLRLGQLTHVLYCSPAS